MEIKSLRFCFRKKRQNMDRRDWIQIIKHTAYCSLVALLVSCTNTQKADNSITFAADESLKPMLDQVYKAYEGTMTDEKFNVSYQPEQEAIKLLLDYKTPLVFTTRDLTANEKNILSSKGVTPSLQPIATDGVALIIGKANIDSLITMEELKQIFDKKITDWSQLKGRKRSGKIVLVFDNANASNITFMMQKFNLKNIDGLNIFAAGSNPKVIDYVRQNPNAIGFIGVNWISDGDTPLTIELSKGLRVMGILERKDWGYRQPFQYDLHYKTYPLIREVYAISRRGNADLGTKLVNYIMRDVGSLVIEKCGLWPKKPFNRELIIKNEL
jgi:phosphate transport system substrate-binding protein